MRTQVFSKLGDTNQPVLHSVRDQAVIKLRLKLSRHKVSMLAYGPSEDRSRLTHFDNVWQFVRAMDAQSWL